MWHRRSCPGGGHGDPLQYSCLDNPWTEELRGLPSMGSPRARHDRGDLARMHRRFPVSCSCNSILPVSKENSIPTLSVTFLSHHYHQLDTVCIWLRSASVLILQNSSVSILAIDWYIAVVIINAVSLWVQSNCGSLEGSVCDVARGVKSDQMEKKQNKTLTFVFSILITEPGLLARGLLLVIP